MPLLFSSDLSLVGLFRIPCRLALPSSLPLASKDPSEVDVPRTRLSSLSITSESIVESCGAVDSGWQLSPSERSADSPLLPPSVELSQLSLLGNTTVSFHLCTCWAYRAFTAN